MASAFLICLREGLEMSLIVGIILAYLARTGYRREFWTIWAGVAGAAAVSVLAGAIIFRSAGEFTGRGEQLFEALAMLTAVAVLTYMIFWMRRQAVTLKTELHSRLSAALKIGSRGALVLLTVAAVGREGVETALFLFATVRASSQGVAAAGAVLGLGGAVLIGALLYRGTYRLNLRAFFNVTSILLLLVGAGLLARAVGELQEAGMVPSLLPHLWNSGTLMPETSPAGSLLQAVFGYISAPSLLQITLYAAYLAAVGWCYFRPVASLSAQSSRGMGGSTETAAPPKA